MSNTNQLWFVSRVYTHFTRETPGNLYSVYRVLENINGEAVYEQVKTITPSISRYQTVIEAIKYAEDHRAFMKESVKL